MKTLALLATVALGLFSAAPLHAQNTQNSQVTADSPASGNPKAATDPTAKAVRRSTRRTTTAPTTQATISARNSARLNAQARAAQAASFNAKLGTRLDGGVVRAVRSGNPLQAVNPLAPAEYGTGEQVTRHEPDDPFQRPQGLKLVVVEF